MPSNSPPPTNYLWVGNTLSYDLDPSVVGLKLVYTKDGQSNTHILHDDKSSAPTSVALSSSLGPKGNVVGITSSGDHSEWGPPSTIEITNSPAT